LDHITQFTPSIDNTISNFIPSNTLISARVIEKKEGTARAEEWINNQIASYPDMETTLLWSRDMFKNKGIPVLPEKEKDAGMRILEKLKMSGMGEK